MFAFLLTLAVAAAPTQNPCSYDRQRLLSLDENAFDQDLKGGWRPLAYNPQCVLVAADLIRDYRAAHAHYSTILFWHEGQLRAEGGQTAAAISLFNRARATEPGHADWEYYVDGTIAFLKRDRQALQSARDKLAAIPRPANFNPTDGDGKPIAIKWPPNLDVLNGLLNCFDRSYAEAYGSACRPMIKIEAP